MGERLGEGATMNENGLYEYQYGRYVKGRKNAEGYDFEEAPAGSAPVPSVTFKEKLRWWTLDRWKRRKKIREERDRRIQEILSVRLQSQK